jgi:hypothetical protein
MRRLVSSGFRSKTYIDQVSGIRILERIEGSF